MRELRDAALKMKRVTGIGGIFFKTGDTEKTKAWYARHLGLEGSGDGSVIFKWRHMEDPEQVGYTVWGPFSSDTKYFDPSVAPFMVNYRVADLKALLARLRVEGVTVDDRIEESEYGRFGWIMDPEGNRIELWEPPEGQ